MNGKFRVQQKRIPRKGEGLAKTIDIWTAVFSKIVGAIAIFVGGWWTYTQFTIHREGASMLDIHIEPTIIRTCTTLLANVSVVLKNVGKVPVYPGYQDSRGTGLELTVIEYQDLTKTVWHNAKLIDWNKGGGAPDSDQWPVLKYNMLQEYQAFKDRNYAINPGTTTRESVVVPLSEDKLYMFRVRFFSNSGWTNSDIVYLYSTPITSTNVPPSSTAGTGCSTKK